MFDVNKAKEMTEIANKHPTIDEYITKIEAEIDKQIEEKAYHGLKCVYTDISFYSTIIKNCISSGWYSQQYLDFCIYETMKRIVDKYTQAGYDVVVKSMIYMDKLMNPGVIEIGW